MRKRMKAETRIESNDVLLFRIGDDLKAMNSAELLARYRDGIANHAAKTREQSQDDPPVDMPKYTFKYYNPPEK